MKISVHVHNFPIGLVIFIVADFTVAKLIFKNILDLFLLLKKVDYCNWGSASSASALALTFTCGRNNLKSCSCILPKFVCTLQMISSRTSSIMSEKNQNGRFIALFCILHQKFDLLGAITWIVVYVSCSNLLCIFLISSSRTSSITAEKIK